VWKTRKIRHVGRGNLVETSLKRRGYLKLLAGCKAILKVLDEGGPLTRSQVMELTKIPKGTIDRYLWVLVELERVERINKKKYALHSDVYIYENKTDRDLALSHSKNVASGLEHLLRKGSYSVRDDSVSGDKYEECALMHLRTGYRELYAVFEKAAAFESDVEQEEKRLMDAVKRRLISLSLPTKTLNPENVARVVYEDIKAALTGHDAGFLSNLGVDGGRVMSGGCSLAGEDVAEQVRNFIRKEEASEENRESVNRIAETENKYCDLRRKFGKEMDALIMRVENGTPLQGSCQMCPRVKVIGRVL